MPHTKAEIKAFIDRCQALVADGEDDEFRWRMNLIIRWWLGQALHSCQGEVAGVMALLVDALDSAGIQTEAVVTRREESTH